MRALLFITVFSLLLLQVPVTCYAASSDDTSDSQSTEQQLGQDQSSIEDGSNDLENEDGQGTDDSSESGEDDASETEA